jgi:hypothetical protein
MTLSDIMPRILKNVEDFSNKMSEATLTEFEMLAYEQLCRLVETWSKFTEVCVKMEIPEAERESERRWDKYRKWQETGEWPEDKPPEAQSE